MPQNDTEDPYGLRIQSREDDMIVIHQSTIGSMDTCGFRTMFGAEAYKQGVYHSGSARAVGTAYHAGLEHWYSHYHDLVLDEREYEEAVHHTLDKALDGYHQERTRTQARNGKFILNKGETHEQNLANVTAMVEYYFNGHHQYDSSRWEVLDTELTFWAPTEDSDTCVTGTGDLFLRHRLEPNWIHIEDHKTAGRMWPAGKEHARKHIQPGFYTAHGKPIFADRYGIDPNKIKISWSFGIMTYKGKFQRRPVHVFPEHEAMAKIRTRLTASAIRDKIYLPNPTSNLCSPKWCDHWQVCPFGEAGEARTADDPF